MKRTVQLLLVLFLISLISPLATRAQEGSASSSDLESCFVYYDYGKVKANLATEKNSYSPGETAKVQGTVVNSNKFPLVGVSLYVQLRRVNDGGDFAQNGHFLVDRLTLLEDLSFLPGETKSIDYQFPVFPSYPNGDYQLQYFIFSKEGFHYSGRPFLEEDNAGVSNFSITGGKDPEIYFDPNSLIVAGTAHSVREFINEYPDQPLFLTVGVTDNRQEKAAIAAKIYIYTFEDSMEANLVSSEDVILRPFNGFLAQTTFVPPHPGAYILLVQIDSPQKSLFKYRFAIAGDAANKLQMNDLGISNFPPAKGDRAYVCFHSPSNSLAPDTQIELQILDGQKKPLETKTVSGAFDSSVQAISLAMTKVEGSRDFWVRAEFVAVDNPQEKQLVEHHYDCNTFAQSLTDLDISFDQEKRQLSTLGTNICGDQVRAGGLIEQIKILQDGKVIQEEYNLTPANAQISLAKLPGGKYTAEVKAGEIVKKIDFSLPSESKKTGGGKSFPRYILLVVVFIILGIGAFAIYKKRQQQT